MKRLMIALALASGPSVAQEAAVEQGLGLFQQNCRTCHVMTEGENRLGPSLHGVVGRAAGSVEGFQYSGAMAGASQVWDEATLDAFIENPSAAFPGTSMIYPGMPDAENRAALIAYILSESAPAD